MFRATVVRRFEVIAPQFQLQSKTVQQAIRTSNAVQNNHETTSNLDSNTKSDNALNSYNNSGRVAMMPGANVRPSRITDGSTASQKTQTNDSFDHILTVGTVSGQGEGQKIFQTAQAEF